MRNKVVFGIVFCVVCLSACSGSDEKSSSEAVKDTIVPVQEKSLVGMINGTIYCMPSPYEITRLVDELKIPYNPSLPNSVMNFSSYESSYKKLINMGIYGIDIAYMSLYEQISEALNYFATLKSLANQVELASVFDAVTMERLENNMESSDSLLSILTSKFYESDGLLKGENQRAEAALILTGTWIESLFVLTQIEKENHNEKIVEKIAEHKFAAESILNILRPYYEKSEEYKQLIDAIVNICYEFDGIDYTYNYQPSTTIASKQTTVINSKSKLTVLPEHVKHITEKIAELRNEIIK